MKQDTNVRAFKNELRNYAYISHEIAVLEDSIEFCYDWLGGVSGVDPSREPSHSLPNKDMEYKIRDKITFLEDVLELRRAEKKRIDQILSRLETELQEAVKAIYVDGKRTDIIARKMFLSPNGLHKRINKALEEALNEE